MPLRCQRALELHAGERQEVDGLVVPTKQALADSRSWPGFPAWAQAVECSVLTATELVKRLTAAIDNPEPGLTIELNGQEWVFDPEKRWIPGSA